MTRGWELIAERPGGSVAALALWTAPDGVGQGVIAATAAGLRLSTDGGRTWRPLGRAGAAPPGLPWPTEAVAVAPGSALFAAAPGGLYCLDDSGAAWRLALRASRVLAIALSPLGLSPLGHWPEQPRVEQMRAEQIVFAGTEADGLLRSEDGGATWTSANAGLLDLTVTALALSPAFATDRTAFAATTSGLYRSRNGGKSWREVALPVEEAEVQCLALSPRFGRDRLALAGTVAHGLFRSDDGGSTWETEAAFAGQSVTAIACAEPASGEPGAPTLVAVAAGGDVLVSAGEPNAWRTVARGLGPALGLLFVADEGGPALLAALPAGYPTTIQPPSDPTLAARDAGPEWSPDPSGSGVVRLPLGNREAAPEAADTREPRRAVPAGSGLMAGLPVALAVPMIGAERRLIVATIEAGLEAARLDPAGAGQPMWVSANTGIAGGRVMALVAWPVPTTPDGAALTERDGVSSPREVPPPPDSGRGWPHPPRDGDPGPREVSPPAVPPAHGASTLPGGGRGGGGEHDGPQAPMLFAATTCGLAVSRDGARSWTLVRFDAAPGGSDHLRPVSATAAADRAGGDGQVGVRALAVAPSPADRSPVGAAFGLDTGNPPPLPPSTVDRSSVGDAGADPALLAALDDGRLALSEDGGQAWRALNPPPDASPFGDGGLAAGARLIVGVALAPLSGAGLGNTTWRPGASRVGAAGREASAGRDRWAIFVLTAHPAAPTLTTDGSGPGSTTRSGGALWLSTDVGANWHLWLELDAPGSALAASPTFAADGLVLVAAGGRVYRPRPGAWEVRRPSATTWAASTSSSTPGAPPAGNESRTPPSPPSIEVPEGPTPPSLEGPAGPPSPPSIGGSGGPGGPTPPRIGGPGGPPARRPLWQRAELSGLPRSGGIYALTLSPAFRQDRTVLAATDTGVYISRDAGATFAAWSDALPELPILALAFPMPGAGAGGAVRAIAAALGGAIWTRTLAD